MANLIDYGNQSQIPSNSGASMLGAMFGQLGQDPNMRPGFLKAAEAGASIANVMAEGRDRQAKYLGRESLAKRLEDEGDIDSAGAVRAGVDPQQVLAAKKIKAELGLQDRAVSIYDGMGLSGDSLANRLLNAADLKPTETTRVEEQNVVHPFDSATAAPAPGPDSSNMRSIFGASASTPASSPMAAAMGLETTAQGMANIREKDASVTDHNAAALEHGAQGRAADALAATRTAGNPLFDAKVAHLLASHAAQTPQDFELRQRIEMIRQQANSAAAFEQDPAKRQAILDDAGAQMDALAGSPAAAHGGPNMASVFADPVGAVRDVLGALDNAPPAPATRPAASSPPPNARQARDGKYYVPDPHHAGKYLQWVP